MTIESDRNIYVWTLPTTASSQMPAGFEQLLAPDEARRAAQIRSLPQRQSFVATRCALRVLLGRVLALSPREVQFHYGRYGKPSVSQSEEIGFNVSHSGELSAIAVTRGCQIGIDLELIRSLPDWEQVVHRFFCSEEAGQIMALPPGERERAFFACWARKEAYLKANGSGLSKSPDSFSVRETAEEDGTLRIQENGGVPPSAPWTIQDLHLSPDYAAALAYRDRKRSLKIMGLQDFELFRMTDEIPKLS